MEGMSVQKKSVPKKKVPPKKKVAPRKKAMPKKQLSTARSTNPRAAIKPNSRGARTTKSVDSTAPKHQDIAPAKSNTELQPRTTNTGFWKKTGVWLSFALVVVIGVAGYYFLGIYTDTSNPNATVVETQGSAGLSEKHVLKQDTAKSQEKLSTESTSLGHSAAKEGQEQNGKESPSASHSTEVTANSKAGQQFTEGLSSTPRQNTQTTDPGITVQESTPQRTTPVPFSRSEMTRDQRSAVPISESQANALHSRTNPNQAVQSPDSILSNESDNSDLPATATQAPRGETATKPDITPSASGAQGNSSAPSIKSDQLLTVPGVNPISSAVTPKVEPTVAKPAPKPPQTNYPAPRSASPVQRPANYPPQPPWDQPQTWPHPRAVAPPPPYGWSGPYGFPGGVVPYPMDPRYSTYRRPPSVNEK
jgi:hypothetical protein